MCFNARFAWASEWVHGLVGREWGRQAGSEGGRGVRSVKMSTVAVKSDTKGHPRPSRLSAAPATTLGDNACTADKRQWKLF